MNEEFAVERQQYLTFTLGDGLFALGVDSVREILNDQDITHLPQTPSYLRGVINLRGSAVPVVDLRLKLGMEPAQATVHTCIIITEAEIGTERVALGALADSVQEVIDLPPDQISAPPQMGSAVDARYIRGMSRQGDRFLIILDADRVFSADDLSAAAAPESPPQ